MGTWGIGPFDNDAAGDLLIEIDEADRADRGEVVREALAAAGTDGFLDYDHAAAAVAAAALVAHAGDAESPAELAAWPLELPADLVPLALHALDRVAGPDSEWRALWADGPDHAEALAQLEAIRSALDRPPG